MSWRRKFMRFPYRKSPPRRRHGAKGGGEGGRCLTYACHVALSVCVPPGRASRVASRCGGAMSWCTLCLCVAVAPACVLASPGRVQPWGPTTLLGR